MPSNTSKMMVAGWSLVGVVTLGCAAPTSVGIRALAAEGANNELALDERYEGERLRVTGNVEKLGYWRSEVLNVDYSPGPFGGTATGTKSYDETPYVALRPHDGSGDALLFCFFSPGDRAELAGLGRGQSITLDGTYGAFKRDRSVSMVSLHDCSIAD
jgi:hypothetical protein